MAVVTVIKGNRERMFILPDESDLYVAFILELTRELKPGQRFSEALTNNEIRIVWETVANTAEGIEDGA